MHCLGVSWALDRGAHLSHYLFLSLHHCISSHLVGSSSSSLLYLSFVPLHLLPPRVVIILSSSHGGDHVIFHYLSYGRWSRDPWLERVTSLERVCDILIFEGMFIHFWSRLWVFLGLRSEHVYLYICKKKKKKRGTCVYYSLSLSMCILVFEGRFVGYVYWWEFVCELPGTFHSSYSFCCMFWEWDEWPSLRSFGSLSIPSLCSLLTWPPFIFDLSRSSLVLIFYVSSSSSFSLLIHHFYCTFYSVLTVTSFSGLIPSSLHHYSLHHHLLPCSQ